MVIFDDDSRAFLCARLSFLVLKQLTNIMLSLRIIIGIIFFLSCSLAQFATPETIIDEFEENGLANSVMVVEKSSDIELDNATAVHSSTNQIQPSSGSGTSSYVIRMLSKAFRFLNLKRMVKNVQSGRSTPGACITCKAAMAMVKYLIDYGNGYKDVAFVTSYFCRTLNVQSPRVCDGYVNNFMVKQTKSLFGRINNFVFSFSVTGRICNCYVTNENEFKRDMWHPTRGRLQSDRKSSTQLDPIDSAFFEITQVDVLHADVPSMVVSRPRRGKETVEGFANH